MATTIYPTTRHCVLEDLNPILYELRKLYENETSLSRTEWALLMLKEEAVQITLTGYGHKEADRAGQYQTRIVHSRPGQINLRQSTSISGKQTRQI
jgi:hypothetical protein